MKKETWSNERFNVPAAEEDISFVKRFRCFIKDGKFEPGSDSLIMALSGGDDERADLIRKAALEMNDIIINKDNSSGYHINHITSGKNVYCVYTMDNFKVYTFAGQYGSKEEAEKAAEEYEDAYAEEIGEGQWCVMSLDKDLTQHEKENGLVSGEYVGEFDTLEEAQAECAAYQYASIDEIPSEEWWVVIDNSLGRQAFKMLFPSENRALAFLYRKAMPPVWRTYVEKCGR